MKYLAKTWDSKTGKQIEQECDAFTFSDGNLYLYFSKERNGEWATSKCLHGVRSYHIGVHERYGLRFIFEGYQPEIHTNSPKAGHVYYEYRKVEIVPIEEPQQLNLNL